MLIKIRKVVNYWKALLNIPEIETMRKSNSGKMSRRNWNSKYGVLTIRFFDTYLKTMINTWLNLLYTEIENEIITINFKELYKPISRK